MSSFENLGKIKTNLSESSYVIDIRNLNEGSQFFDKFIVFKKKNELKIYSRICDHAGGKIITRNGQTICPIHNWVFEPSIGFYNNGVKKKEILWKYLNNYEIEFKVEDFLPEIKKSKELDLMTSIRFFNHAFLKVYGENFSFCTDPWAIGPAFNTGWWLKKQTKDDWISELNNSNFIFVSHNHPDHLHPLTLSKLDKSKTIVVPNFKNDSTGRYIKDLGFENIIRLDFNYEYKLRGTDLIICLFKSGDFREDSGIFFSNGNFSSLFAIDSNLINFGRLPKVDLYASSFAGGASGYPLMFDNFTNQQKIEITKRNRFFIKSKLFESLDKTQPEYFLPYAGFFEEKLPRDQRVKKLNIKNKIDDYKNFCANNNIKLLNPLQKDLYKFIGKKLTQELLTKTKYTKDIHEIKYLEYFTNSYNSIDEVYIKNYFENSGFKENIHLFIQLTDDFFNPIEKNYFIDFTKKLISFSKIIEINEDKIFLDKDINKLILKIRKESFLNTIYNKLPWEDLLIGFQCRVLRQPNLYNVNFWHHFTNIYTTSKNVRSSLNCNSCKKIESFFDNEIRNLSYINE